MLPMSEAASQSDTTPVVIGLVSDTHGLVRRELFTALAGVHAILHAGDVGGAGVLDELATIAPTEAVYGNTDAPGDPRLCDEIVRVFGGLTVHVSHGHEVGAPTPARLLARHAGDVIVYGHTHRPLIERHDSRLVVNPGAAGPRRFDIRPTVALLRIDGRNADVEIIALA
jgi:uncharacterized protein